MEQSEAFDYASQVRNLYNDHSRLPIPITREHALRAGMIIERLFPPGDSYSAFSILASLNLLNATLKTTWGTEVVRYDYVKGMAACLFMRQLACPVSGLKVYMDYGEQVTYFRVLGVQFSFHYLPLYLELLHLLRTAHCEKQVWDGLRLQHIAVELFMLACPYETMNEEVVESDVAKQMLHYHKPKQWRVFCMPSRMEALLKGKKRRQLDLSFKACEERLFYPDFNEDLLASLQTALNISIWHEKSLLLWRRRDGRPCPLIRYDGTNYRMLLLFLIGHQSRICRRAESSLEVGKFYYVSPQKRIRSVPLSKYVQLMARNNYLLVDGEYRNLCVTYGIACYLAALHPNMKFVCTLNFNRRLFRQLYYTAEDLLKLDVQSEERHVKVWIIVDTAHELADFSYTSLPLRLIIDYLNAKDCYKEFEVVKVPSGKMGVVAFSNEVVLPPLYRRVRLYNYYAYVQNEERLWAIFSLGGKRFLSGFQYEKIWYDSAQGAVMGSKDNKHIPIYRFSLSQ